MEGVFHDAEDVKILANGDADRLIERVGRFEPYAVWSTPQPFHRVLPVVLLKRESVRWCGVSR